MLLCENALMPHSCCKHSRDLSTPRPSEWFGKGPSGARAQDDRRKLFSIFLRIVLRVFATAGLASKSKRRPFVWRLSFLRFCRQDPQWQNAQHDA